MSDLGARISMFYYGAQNEEMILAVSNDQNTVIYVERFPITMDEHRGSITLRIMLWLKIYFL